MKPETPDTPDRLADLESEAADRRENRVAVVVAIAAAIIVGIASAVLAANAFNGQHNPPAPSHSSIGLVLPNTAETVN